MKNSNDRSQKAYVYSKNNSQTIILEAHLKAEI